jgi:hypothetical protein
MEFEAISCRRCLLCRHVKQIPKTMYGALAFTMLFVGRGGLGSVDVHDGPDTDVSDVLDHLDHMNVSDVHMALMSVLALLCLSRTIGVGSNNFITFF